MTTQKTEREEALEAAERIVETTDASNRATDRHQRYRQIAKSRDDIADIEAEHVRANHAMAIARNNHTTGEDHVYAVARALLSSSKAEGEMREDAERWRALMASQRIRVMGSAGIYSMEADLRAPTDGYMHMGVEFWSLHRSVHPSKDFPQERCREALTFYADQLRAALSPKEGGK